jgi:hypothetical protein
LNSERKFKLKRIDGHFGIVKLGPARPVPAWAMEPSFCSVTRTETELTIVCPEKAIPADVEYEGSWQCIRVEGAFDFQTVGVIAPLSGVLARNGISIYVISSYVTDYILIRRQYIEKAVRALEREGHVFLS